MKNKTLKKSTKSVNITKVFLEMLNTVKLYHWKTYSYSTHNATNELYKDLNKYIDEFIEVLLGKTETRIPSFKCNITIENSSSTETFKKKVDSLPHLLNIDSLISNLPGKNSKELVGAFPRLV